MTLRTLLRALPALVLLGFFSFSRPASAQTNAGDCPPDTVNGAVKDLADAVTAVAGTDANSACAAALANTDLSRVKNLATEFGCKDDGPCTLKKIIDEMAKESGLPADLLYAVAWTETNWHQWKPDGKAIVSRSGDIGLFQINKSWKGQYDMTQVAGDVLYNARAASKITRWAYDYAKSRGLKGNDLYRATYAVYNGGPAALRRPWDARSPWAGHDRNFSHANSSHPWAAETKHCG
ncbi:MAG TPA: transglycosylase SLT domain-containing protein [bacterium]|nr:transglycosylase SLT domain-containing protein [bacterium]